MDDDDKQIPHGVHASKSGWEELITGVCFNLFD
jgi:hypothetical protein